MTNFKFHINKFDRIGETNVFKVFVLMASASTVEDAFEVIKPQIPEGHKVWAWNEEINPDFNDKEWYR